MAGFPPPGPKGVPSAPGLPPSHPKGVQQNSGTGLHPLALDPGVWKVPRAPTAAPVPVSSQHPPKRSPQSLPPLRAGGQMLSCPLGR